MIRAFVDYSLRNKLLILAVGILLLAWGAISFKNLPVEAYPDVANNYVQVITQWPGRAAEEVEQQVTVPIEVQMSGIPHLSTVRSISEFGLSVVTMNFDDSSVDDWNRQKVLERLSMVTLPSNIQPTIGPDYSPVGQLYWYTLKSTNPEYDLMELKSLQDWVLAKQLKTVPDVIDVSSFGGLTREYQVQVDPNKLIAYGLSVSQLEQALSNNNSNAGGSFIQSGAQQINIREVGLVRNIHDIECTVLKSQNGTPVSVRDVAFVTQGPKIRLGQIGKAIHRKDGVVVDDADAVEGIVLLRKGANGDAMLTALHQK
ncbi:MAG TPA: efflux RND transporter permease subunit, partial [Bryobacteraceae bacterium]|nr:efflux RND transporter permease subunit [Bryobacteraceae bacterium]